MRHLRLTSGVLAVIGISALILTGTPALAGTQSSKSVTGPEVLFGEVSGAAANANNPIIPLTLTGVVDTTAPKFALGNGAVKKHGVPTRVGTLFVMQTGTPTSTQSGNIRSCLETFTQDVTFRVLGSSTGVFAGASGPGAAQIHFAAYAPRFTSGPHKGQCNFNGTPLNKGAVGSFLASIVLTIKK